MELLNTVLQSRGSELMVLSILKRIILKLAVNSSTYRLVLPDTPSLQYELLIYCKNNENHCPKKWSLLVEAFSQVFREKYMRLIKRIVKNPQQMDRITNLAVCSQPSIQKIAYTSFVKLALEFMITEPFDADPEASSGYYNYYMSFLKDKKRMPFMVYIIQQLKVKNSEGKALNSGEDKNFKSAIDLFISNYYNNSESMDEVGNLNSIKILPTNLSYYMEVKHKFICMVTQNNMDSLKECLTSIFPESLPSIATKQNSRPTVSSLKSSITSKKSFLKNILFVVVNEYYLSYSIDKKQGDQAFIQGFLENLSIKIQNESSKKIVRLCILLVSNFESINTMRESNYQNGRMEELMTIKSHLSLSKKESRESILTKMNVIHLLIELLFCDNSLLGSIFSNKKDQNYTQRMQLGALVGPKEQDQFFTYSILRGFINPGGEYSNLYRCPCGYLYWIGDCGKAMEVSDCPICGKQIGGRNHKLSNLGTEKYDYDKFCDKIYSKLEMESQKVYQVRTNNDNIESNSKFTQWRCFVAKKDHSIVEIIGNTRYLLDMIIGSHEEVNALKDFIPSQNISKYLLSRINLDYGYLFENRKNKQLTRENYYHVFQGYYIDMFKSSELKSASSRNGIEISIIKHLQNSMYNSNYRLKRRNQRYKQFYKSVESKKELIQSWINRIASISDLKELDFDLKIVLSMRVHQEPCLNDLKNFLEAQMNLIPSTDQGITSPPSSLQYYQDDVTEQKERILFLKDIIKYDRLISVFGEIVQSIKKFTSYLSQEFEFSITFNQACELKLKTAIEQISNQKKREIIKEEFDILKEYCIELESVNNKDFRGELNLRYQCHRLSDITTQMSSIFDFENAKLIHFLSNINHSETLLFPSIMYTLAEIQSSLIDKYGSCSNSIDIQECPEEDLLHFKHRKKNTIRDYLGEISYTNPFFGKDNKIEFNLIQLECNLKKDLFLEVKKTEFDGTNILQNFSFLEEFHILEKMRGMMKQTINFEDQELELNQMKQLKLHLEEDALKYYSKFSLECKRILILYRQKYPPIKLPKIILFNDLKLSLGHLDTLVILMNNKLINQIQEFLPVGYQKSPDSTIKESFTKYLKGIDTEMRENLRSILISLVLNQIIGDKDSKLSSMSIKSAILYSEKLNEIQNVATENFKTDDLGEHICQDLDDSIVLGYLPFLLLDFDEKIEL